MPMQSLDGFFAGVRKGCEDTMRVIGSKAPGRLVAAVTFACLLTPASAGSSARAAPATPPGADGQLVQKRAATISSGTTVSATFRHATSAGDLIVAFAAWDAAGGLTIADTKGNEFASAVGPARTGDGSRSAQVLYAANVASGHDTVTVQFARGVASFGALFIFEYRDADPAVPFDTAISSTGSAARLDTGMLRTGRAGELLFAAAASNGTAISHVSKGYRVELSKRGAAVADAAGGKPGPGRFRATQDGTTWVTFLVAFEHSNSAPPPPSYPLQVGPTGRYLVDASGVPVQVTGDSPQALMVNLSETDADAFFADRQAAGFNAVWINLLCATYTGGRPDGSTYDGIVPFTTPGDLSTPNEAYFERVDDMMRLAASHDLTVFLDPAETGSFLSVLLDNGVQKSRDYGRFLGARYKDFDNIVWMSGNDFQSWENPGDDAVVQAVAQGIHDADPRHIHTVELDYPVSGSLDDPTWAPLIQLNASYTYYPTYAQVLTDYNRPQAPPTFLVEANYEFEHNADDEGTPEILRRQEYWSLLGGAAGQFYGNHWTWPFLEGWQDHLDTTGSVQMAHVVSLFDRQPWFDLIPDQSHSVVTAGYGTYADDGALGDSDYLTAARTPDGALVMAYMPTRRTITVDMSTLGAPAFASWYDPSAGVYAAVKGSPLPNAGSRSFTPPGPNADGDGDWVLVLDAPGVPKDTQAPAVPAGLNATSVGDTSVSLSWQASNDDVGVAGYRIYRTRGPQHTTRETEFTDTGLEPNTTYTYRVAAFDYAGNRSHRSPPLTVTTAPPAPAFVQASFATPQSPASSVTATYTKAQIAGDANILAIGWNDTVSKITSVTDSTGNTYTKAVGTIRGNGLSQAICVAADVAAAAAGSNQVTVTFDRPATFVDLRITEYSGLSHTSPFDLGASATGTGTVASTPPVAVATPSKLLFAAGMTSATFTAPGDGYTARVITAPDGDLIEDRVAYTPGDYAATASLSGGTWLLQLAVFEPGS
jgi:chitodextrinase